MMVYKNELLIRIWEGDPGHASFTLRSVTPQAAILQTNVSWFPAQDDLNRHRKDADFKFRFQTRTADPSESYRADSRWEAGDRVQARYQTHLKNLAWKEARRIADSLELDLSTASSEKDKLAEFHKALEDLNNHVASDPNHEHWLLVKYYLENYLLRWETKLTNPKYQFLPDPTLAPLAPTAPTKEFVLRPNQRIKNGEVVVPALLKRNLPGMYSELYINHIAGDRPAIGKVVNQKTLDDIHRYIPAGEKAYWGLNLSAIAGAWANFLGNNANGYKYASASHNCAGVVHQMLVAGGVEAFVKTQSAWLYREPRDIEELGDQLVERLLDLNERTLTFKQQMIQENIYDNVPLVNGDLWPLNTFRTNSNVGKVFAMRKEQVGKIDKYMNTYHSKRWTSEHFVAKYQALVNIFENILEHRRLKPNSDRRRGVDSLGIQILKLIESDIPAKIHSPLLTQMTNANTARNSWANRVRGVGVK